MSWTDETLADFGRQLGLNSLSFSHDGFVQLELANGGVLGLTRGEDEVLVWLTRILPDAGGAPLERALAACDYRNNAPFTIQAGVRGDHELALTARLAERTFTLPALGQALECLTRLHDQAAGR